MVYQAFISYSHTDEKLAVWLHRALENYRIPARLAERHGLASRRLVPIFRDRDELATSEDLSATIIAALQSSLHLIVICSPEAARSRWVDAEIRQFRALRPDGRVLCLLTEEPSASFPQAVLDGAAGEPLAADIREHGDGREGAKLKLIAGLLGVGLDELKQRDAQQRQRRLVAVAVGSVAGMGLAIGLAALALIAEQQAQRAEARAVAEAARANQEARTASRTLGFLTEILREADPAQSRGAEITVREVLERAAARLETELEEEPLVRAQLLESIGDIYDGMGDYERAAALINSGVETYRDAVGDDDQRTLKARAALASAWWRLGRYEEAGPVLQEVHARQSALLGPDHADARASLAQLASLSFRRGDYARAEALYRQVWEADVRLEGADAIRTLGSLNNLANAIDRLGRTEEAATHFEFILARRRELQGEDHPDALGAAANLASAYTTLRRLDEAEPLELATLAGRLRVLGPEHPDTLTSLSNLARLVGMLGRFEESAKLYREVVDVRTRVLGPTHPLTLEGRVNLGMTLRDLGEYEAAVAELAEAAAMLDATGAGDHPTSLLARTELAVALAWGGRDAEAERVLEAALPDLQRLLGPTHRQTRDALYNLACLAARQAKVERALDHLEAAVAAGFSDPVLLEDPDLESLRAEPRFAAIASRFAPAPGPR